MKRTIINVVFISLSLFSICKGYIAADEFPVLNPYSPY